jgi:hypothetical protein
VIPSGLFAVGDAGESESFRVSPRMLMSGVVTHADLRRNTLFGGTFARLAVRSLGATFQVVVDIRDLPTSGDSQPVPPAVGSIVSGQFWLSGRVLASGRDEARADRVSS